ncbi:MAG: Uma2 family endonuclease [Blastocatellia bacterium]
MTAATELAFAPDREVELVDGKPEVKDMAGARHGGVTARLLIKVGSYVEDNFLGGVYTPDTTFQIGLNERLPDIGFISAERIPEDGEPEGLWTIAPDLAVEVISPNDIWEKVMSKVRNYFTAGVQEVWLVSPEQQTITIHHSLTTTTILISDDELSSEALLPGFRCRVSDIFQPSVRRKQQ